LEVHCYDLGLSLERLGDDARTAMRGWDWGRGAFGQALSLPEAEGIHPYRRHSFHNHPYAGALARCGYFREIFDELKCEKVSFRLLRLAPGSAYGWHHDRWKGPGVVRFQIPILTSPDDRLVVTDYERVEQIRPRGSVDVRGAGFAAFARLNDGHYRVHHLAAGKLHYFDSSRVHTLVNANGHARVTLSFDLHANDWLRARFPEIRAEAGEHSHELPRPERWRLALARGAAGLYPLRNRAHLWLRSRKRRERPVLEEAGLVSRN
jgi:hypothetical protein